MADRTEEVITVAELDRRLKRAVEGATGRHWIEGEIGSLKRAASGHVYFSLKDETEEAVIDCVMYRFNAQRARRHLKEGARVQMLGRATVWAPRGRLQLVGEWLRPAGKGALLEALEQLKHKLQREGLFDTERKRPLPEAPRTVGVVTSSEGAAFHDVRTVAFRRGGVKLVLSPARVQGEGAASRIVWALDLLSRYPGLDVVIVGRGGGSLEDLMAFNDERVVRRVATYPVPIVSAVGHEVDVTLCDLAADVRAATPSQAAELVIPDGDAYRQALARLRGGLGRAMRGRLLAEHARVARLRSRLADPRMLIIERQQSLDERHARLERQLAREINARRTLLEGRRRRLSAQHPQLVLARARSQLGPLAARAQAALQMRLTQARAELGQRVARLDALSPLAVLARGYAIALNRDGQAIRSATEVRPGDRLALRLAAGRLAADVVSVEPPAQEGEGPPSASGGQAPLTTGSRSTRNAP